MQKGSPAGKVVQLQYSVTHDLAKQAGTLTTGDVSMGKAVAHLAGTYDAHGATTSINMKLSGQGMPVDDLEAMLPAMGVVLPPKSQLKGGALALEFSITGPVDKLVTAGTIKLENSALAGFSLGSQMSAVSALGGKGAGEKDTTIQHFSADIHVAPEGTRADNIDLSSRRGPEPTGMMDDCSLRFCLAHSATVCRICIILAADWQAAFFRAASGSFCAVGGIEGSEFLFPHGESQAGRTRPRLRSVAFSILRSLRVRRLRAAVYPYGIGRSLSLGRGSRQLFDCDAQHRRRRRLRQRGFV